MIEKTVVIIKPDAINRGLFGEIVHRFERKGLKIVAMKMLHLTDEVLQEHYEHLADKDFFPTLKQFMQASPTVVMPYSSRVSTSFAPLIARNSAESVLTSSGFADPS